MKKRQMYIRMITASLLRRRSRMVIALLAIAIGATILSGLVTIYIDVPRQMGAQFRSYGANMLLTGQDETMTKDQIEGALAVVKKDELVGAAAFRYETVRINDTAVMAASADMSQVQKTSPFWMVDGQWPAQSKEIMVGKNVAETYNLKIGKRVTCTYSESSEGDMAKVETSSTELGNDQTGNDQTAKAQDAKTQDAKTETSEVEMDSYLDFTVTGILDTGGKEEDYVYMNLEDMETLTKKENTFHVCEVSVSADSDKLKMYVEEMKKVEPEISAKLVKKLTESETTVLSKLKALVLLVTIVVLALTMICVATTMTAVVAERRKEIGLRKALGASNESIVAEFMGEGILLGAAGGLLGSILGFVFAQMVSINVFNSSITLMPWLIPVTIVVSVLVTGLACMIPIKSATEVDPALVLKGE